MLDNFEHLLEAAPIVTELLAARARATRARDEPRAARLTGEHQYAVAPLPEAEAVDLFIERAAAVGADIEQDGRRVAEICRRLDCLPLAIELAAARAKLSRRSSCSRGSSSGCRS